MTPDIFADIGKFFSDLRQSLADGRMFLGGPLDTVIAVVDILATTLVLYYLLKLFRDSRAWQLMKGILMILAFALISNVVGLGAIGLLLNNTISFLAIAFIVLFQPELRRTLETVGRNSFGRLSVTLAGDMASSSYRFTYQLVESIVSACEFFAETKTGALLIIERETKLGDLAEQENAVQLDAAVSTTLLKQIFYAGSPLHDGAILIRDGRITAARVHMPLSDNYHLRHELGTRHRAAVGASEMGDALSIVVSEERGTISLAVGGRLYVLSNADALRTHLHRLLMTDGREASSSRLGRFLGRSARPRRRQGKAVSGDEVLLEDELPAAAARPSERFARGRFRRPRTTVPRRQRVMLFVVSLVVALGLWLYVQVTVNPITTRVYNVTLSFRGTEELAERGLAVQTLPAQSIQLTLTARTQTLNRIGAQDITAFLDFSVVNRTGLAALQVQIVKDTLLYTRTDQLLPTQITVNVYETEP